MDAAKTFKSQLANWQNYVGFYSKLADSKVIRPTCTYFEIWEKPFKLKDYLIFSYNYKGGGQHKLLLRDDDLAFVESQMNDPYFSEMGYGFWEYLRQNILGKKNSEIVKEREVKIKNAMISLSGTGYEIGRAHV